MASPLSLELAEHHEPLPLTELREVYWLGRRDTFALYAVDIIQLPDPRQAFRWNVLGRAQRGACSHG